MNIRHLLIALSAAVLAIFPTGAAEISSPRLEAVTSWIGNSYGGAPRWVQQDLEAMWVAADGTVFTNVGWEEGGGNAGAYKDGELLGFARHTHGWGVNGGRAIAANDRYVFLGLKVSNEGGSLRDPAMWPEKGTTWFGISRRLRSDFTKGAPFPGGKGGKGDTLKEAFLPVVVQEEKPPRPDHAAEVSEPPEPSLAGLAADAARVFASEAAGGKMHVFDAETMQPVGEWKIDRAGPLALDPAGALWMLQAAAADGAASLVKYDREGHVEARLALPAKLRSTAFCFTPRGEVLVNDARAQQLWLLKLDAGALAVVAALGEPGGIFSAAGGKAAGAFGDLRWHEVSAVGCDSAGNIYAAHHGSTSTGSTVLESYTPDARLRWRLFGLGFVDMADVDPADDTQIFTKEERFAMDYAQPRGREWSYAAFTAERTRFPEDPRLHLWSAGAWVRRIGGARVLFVTDMNGEALQVYRFDAGESGEIARPSGLFSKKRIDEKKSPGWPAHQPGRGEWIWRDANGDGRFDSGEFTASGGEEAPPAQGWSVDASGGVWLATERAGLRYFPPLGLDARGNPQWSYATMQTFPHPAEFDRVKRVRYLPESDTLFLMGTTAEDRNQHWKPSGPVLARYDGWLRGERRLRWRIVAPYARGASGHTSCEPMGFDVAGDFVFVPYTGASKEAGFATGHVEIFKTEDGAGVGHLEPSADIGEIGLQDIRECLRAHRRADGEYLVLLEDDYKSKVLLYRWRPK